MKLAVGNSTLSVNPFKQTTPQIRQECAVCLLNREHLAQPLSLVRGQGPCFRSCPRLNFLTDFVPIVPIAEVRAESGVPLSPTSSHNLKANQEELNTMATIYIPNEATFHVLAWIHCVLRYPCLAKISPTFANADRYAARGHSVSCAPQLDQNAQLYS